MGLLELRATLNAAQFWPSGTADADTIKVALQGKRAGFVYDGRPTRAFTQARIANKPVISARQQVTVRLQGIDAPELHYRPTFQHRAADEQTRIGEWNRSFRQPLGEAAGVGAGIAHQVLGAIGFTREHVLHRFTQRLWAWRDDFDNESAWAVRLGRLVAARGSDSLWPLLASR